MQSVLVVVVLDFFSMCLEPNSGDNCMAQGLVMDQNCKRR